MEYQLNGIKSINNKNKKTMKKFYLKSGEEVQIGDIIAVITKKEGPHFSETITKYIKVTEDILLKLLDDGIITSNSKKDTVNKYEVPMDMEYYIQKIANRFNWKFDKVCNYLDNVDAIYPAAAFSMILREIAIELDKKYKDHIENSPEIYVISMFDGRITKANKAHIKNYRNFAAFRSVEDAKIACNIMKDILKELFKSGK